MKVLSRNLVKKEAGILKVLLEDVDDIWHIYNVINVKDIIECHTTRNVPIKRLGGEVDKKSVHMKMALVVEKKDLDLLGETLRISGRNLTENQYVKIGAFHTVQLKPSQDVVISKEVWDHGSLIKINMACDIRSKSEIVVIVLQQELGHLCFITDNLTVYKSKFHVNISNKMKNTKDERYKEFVKLFSQIYDSVTKLVDCDAVNVVILASPGFYKDSLYDFIFDRAEKERNDMLKRNKHKFIKAKCSSGHRYSVKEVISNPSISKNIGDVKSFSDTMQISRVNGLLTKEPDMVFYGLEQVSKVLETGAIDTLLVLDELLLSVDLDTRMKMSSLVDLANHSGAKVYIISSMHLPGEQLKMLTGIAAISKYPIPELNQDPNDQEQVDEVTDLLQELVKVRALQKS